MRSAGHSRPPTARPASSTPSSPSRHARRPQHPRHSRCRAIPGPDVSLVELGPLEIDCGRTRRIDRHGCQRDPVRTRDRCRGRAPDGVPAHADLGEPPLRRTVHRRTAGTLRTRSRRGAQGARRGVPGIRGRQLRRRLGNDEGPDGDGPRVPGPQSARSGTARQADPVLPVGCKRPLQSRAWFPTSRGRT